MRRTWLVVAAAVTVSACGGSPGTLTGSEVERAVRPSLQKPGQAVLIHCPATIPEKKGKIVDCPVRVGSDMPVLLRVTQDDDEGHFHSELTAQQALGDPEICDASKQRLVADIDQFNALTADATDGKHADEAVTWSKLGSRIKAAAVSDRAAGCDLTDVAVPNHLEVFP